MGPCRKFLIAKGRISQIRQFMRVRAFWRLPVADCVPSPKGAGAKARAAEIFRRKESLVERLWNEYAPDEQNYPQMEDE